MPPPKCPKALAAKKSAPRLTQVEVSRNHYQINCAGHDSANEASRHLPLASATIVYIYIYSGTLPFLGAQAWPNKCKLLEKKTEIKQSLGTGGGRTIYIYILRNTRVLVAGKSFAFQDPLPNRKQPIVKPNLLESNTDNDVWPETKGNLAIG